MGQIAKPRPPDFVISARSALAAGGKAPILKVALLLKITCEGNFSAYYADN